MKRPKWLKITPKLAKKLKVIGKALLKGIVIAGAGLVVKKFGGNNEAALAVAAITHPILKWLDPNDPQLGINSAG